MAGFDKKAYAREWKRKQVAKYGPLRFRRSSVKPDPVDLANHRESVLRWLAGKGYKLDGGWIPSEAIDLAKSAGLL